MTLAYLSLGSNLGNRPENLKLALDQISRLPQTRILRLSSVYETGPVLPPSSPPQGQYLNLVAEIETRLPPRELLDRLLEIEQKLGRVRREKNESRIVDIDILLYDQTTISSDALVIPHPRLRERRFVLEPLSELNPGLRDPVQGRTVIELLESAPRSQEVKRTSLEVFPAPTEP